MFSSGTVYFGAAEFSGGQVSFDGAEFSGGEVYFGSAKFSSSQVNFCYAEFSGGRVSFDYAAFSGGRVFFGSAEFPGGQPGRPISATHLGQRLKDLGIQPGQARSTALFQLATELPAALLARMLGIHIDVAVAWQHASAGDWMAYAADVSRRRQED